jgi:hypothetical protein
MKTMYVLSLIACVAITMSGCTKQQRASGFGGTADIEIPAGQKLVNVTWEKADLWYLTRAMKANESAETYTLHEQSSFGAMQGTVLLHEHAIEK